MMQAEELEVESVLEDVPLFEATKESVDVMPM